MNTYHNLLLEIDNGVAVVSINRPKALNALNSEVLKEIKSMMNDLEVNEEVRTIILTGAGEKSFVAGADIAEMSCLSPQDAELFGQVGNDAFHTIEKLSKPVIAAINGFALGGGCELAMSCDIRIASEKARFGQPEVGLGVTPGFGGTQRLSRLVGKGMAKLLILSGRTIKAEEANRIGLVELVVAPEELMNTARALANEIASKSPQGVRLSKKAINEGLDLGLLEGTNLEAKYFGECFRFPDQKEGMTAFLEKRTPKY